MHETIRVDLRRKSRSSLAKDPLVAATAAIAPPPYDTEYFNYDSMHLLSAKTLSTDSAPTTDSRLLWYMDSAASLYCTFYLLDIVNPVALPEPASIGSSSIISATHCGRSQLSPLILVHYVPESKVSLGALTRQGFTPLASISVPVPSRPTMSGPAHPCSWPRLLPGLLVAPANPSFFTKE